MNYSNEKLERDIKILKVQNSIQTIAVIVFFFFGVATIYDLKKKFSK
jgi:hypothetical protein